MTDDDLAVLKANTDKRVAVTCRDGEIVIGAVVMVSVEDVLLDDILQPDGSTTMETVLSVPFSEIASVRPADEN